MQLDNHYRTMTSNHDFGIKEYITPHRNYDPKMEILHREWEDYKNKRKQGKFKVTTKPRVSYFDEIIKPIKQFPGAPRYKVEGDILKRSKSTSNKKILVNQKLKKETYIDDIEAFQIKQKPPGIGKFDLTKFSDFGTKKHSSLKKEHEQERVKFNNFDDTTKIAAELPGPGQFNPHKRVDKIKEERKTFKDWQEKHQKEQKRRAKSVATKMGPSTYTPIMAGTFESKAANKERPISRWSHGTIEIRKGLRSQYKQPSSCQYNTVNQWVRTSSKKQLEVGNVHLYQRVSSARTFSVYH